MPDPICEFVVYIRPEPKRRPRFGNGRTYTDERTVAYEGTIATQARKAMGSAKPATGPVSVHVRFTQTDARVCDLDNAGKAVLDAMNGITYADDRQVCDLRLEREIHADANSVHVTVTEVAT